MPLRPVAALLVIAAFAGPALAQSADQDVQCILAGNAFGAIEKDPARKQLALASALFFAGRADARLPPAQFRTVLIAQAKALATTNAALVMTACAKQFQSKERALQAIGQEVAQSQHIVPRPPVKK